jgi:20S proteasome alpha/beta subunit
VIREGFRKKMTMEESEILAIKTMRVVIENKITEKDLELCLLNSKTKNFTFLDNIQIKSILDHL